MKISENSSSDSDQSSTEVTEMLGNFINAAILQQSLRKQMEKLLNQREKEAQEEFDRAQEKLRCIKQENEEFKTRMIEALGEPYPIVKEIEEPCTEIPLVPSVVPPMPFPRAPSPIDLSPPVKLDPPDIRYHSLFLARMLPQTLSLRNPLLPDEDD